MPKTPDSNDDLVRICCRIKRSNLIYLKRLAKTNSELGYNMLIRNIVADYVRRMEDLERQNNDSRGTARVELTEEDLAVLDLSPEELDLELEG